MIAHPLPAHRKLLLVPSNDSITTLIPGAATISVGARTVTLVPHVEESVRVLRNCKVDCPAPILSYYDWCGSTPFESQKLTADMLTTNQRAYVFNEIGTGKTRSALYAFDYLKKTGRVHRALVLAPLSTLTMAWDREVFEFFPHLRSVVVHGERQRRLKLLTAEADIYIVNHDGLKVAGILEHLIARADIDCIIVDELALFRNQATALHKRLFELVRHKTWVWGMTGSPTPNEPTDAWGQARIITPWRTPPSFRQFRNQTMTQVSNFIWRPKSDAVARVAELLQPAVRFTRDAQPPTYSDREIVLPPALKAVYQDMLKRLVVDVQGQRVKAVNAGVQMSKLLQLASGFVYDNEGKPRFLGGLERIKETKAIIEQAEGKVIVYGSFTFQVGLFGLALKRWFPTATVYGEVSKKERDEIFADFQFGSTRVLVAHPRTMSHGLTLTAANVIVWASPYTSLEIYEQANGRIHRHGQTRHPHVMHLVGTPVERRVYARLKANAKVQNELLAILEDSTDDTK